MFDEKLPIEEIRQDFKAAVSKGSTLVLTAPTASGKSTRLPLWLAEDLSAPVLVVEPRRVACRSLASFLSSQSNETLGEHIGYRVRFSDCSSERCRVLFVTPGVALKMFQKGDLEFSSVMVDEFHERGWECDLIVTLLRKELKERRERALVITSATIDGAHLAKDWGARHIETKGRLYPVEVEYSEDSDSPSSKDLELRVEKALRRSLDEGEGDILVFLPGKREIEDCYCRLRPLSLTKDFELYRLHGSMACEAVTRALEENKRSRAVFLSTNVAETSITVPGVETVIDSGLCRIRKHRAGRSGLVLEAIAQSSMKQRKGRAGRLKPGRCIRLWSRSFEARALTPPAIERVELDDCLLNAAACGLSLLDWKSLPWP